MCEILVFRFRDRLWWESINGVYYWVVSGTLSFRIRYKQSLVTRNSNLYRLNCSKSTLAHLDCNLRWVEATGSANENNISHIAQQKKHFLEFWHTQLSTSVYSTFSTPWANPESHVSAEQGFYWVPVVKRNQRIMFSLLYRAKYMSTLILGRKGSFITEKNDWHLHWPCFLCSQTSALRHRHSDVKRRCA